MTQDEIVKMAREAGLVRTGDKWVEPARWGVTELVHFAALVAAAERERICKAIKEEDDYCVTEGNYMLDSNDCIAVAKSEWVRPDYSAGAIRARGNT